VFNLFVGLVLCLFIAEHMGKGRDYYAGLSGGHPLVSMRVLVAVLCAFIAGIFSVMWHSWCVETLCVFPAAS
jgi:hypothetical protein